MIDIVFGFLILSFSLMLLASSYAIIKDANK